MKNRSTCDSFDMKFIKEIRMYIKWRMLKSIMIQEFLLDLQGDNYV